MRQLKYLTMVGCAIGAISVATQIGCDAVSQNSSANNFKFRKPNPDVAQLAGYEFEAPVRLTAGDEVISVESPGYACPTMADVDQDGRLDLIVGQFKQGKLHFFKNISEEGEQPAFAKGEWIKSGSDPAIVPRVL